MMKSLTVQSMHVYASHTVIRARLRPDMARISVVLSTENNIFCQKGITYQCVIGEGRKDVLDTVLPKESIVPDREKLILDFGDAWFLLKFILRQTFYESTWNMLPEESDTLIVLIF